MKSIYSCIVLSALIFTACAREDLVEGSLPPKKGTNLVSPNLDKIVIYFKDRIDENSLSLDADHIWVDEIYGGTVVTLPGFTVFQPFPPHLANSDTVNDTLVLFIKPSFSLDSNKLYRFTLDKHQLYCTAQGQEPPSCPQLQRPFFMSFQPAPVEADSYEPPYDPAEDPPYIERISPPDEENFPAAPPFPPHGPLQVWFSEPVPFVRLAASSTQPTAGNTLASVLPDDLVSRDLDTGAPFDSKIHRKLIATTVEGWPIHEDFFFTLVSAPSYLNDRIDCAVLDGATHCQRPFLSNMVLSPTRDASGAPIILADAATLVETPPGSGMFWGTYLEPFTDPGSIGTLPDNIDVRFHLARVRIDYPDPGHYFNCGLSEGCTIQGIYTYDSSTVDENVTAVAIFKNGNLLGNALLSNGIFELGVSTGLTVGQLYEFKAVALAPDGQAGFDVINAIAADDSTPPNVLITSPASGSYLNNMTVTVIGRATDTETGIAWVKVNEVPATLDGSTFTATITGFGPIIITAVAADGVGNLNSNSLSVTVDPLPPDIYIASPIAGSYVNTRDVVVLVWVNDFTPLSSVMVNGVSAALLSGSTYSATLPNMVDGSTILQAQATDAAGNTGYATPVTITVDTTPPSITIIEPQHGSATTVDTIAITIGYSDSLCGVYTDSLSVSFNFQNITNDLTVTSTGATGSAIGQEGWIPLYVHLCDQMGNCAFAESWVLIAFVQPSVTVTEVFPQVAKPGDYITVTGANLGVDPSSMTYVYLNGDTVVPEVISSRSELVVQVSPAAATFSFPPFEVGVFYPSRAGGTEYRNPPPEIPLIVTGSSPGEIPEEIPGPTLMMDGQTAFGQLREAGEEDLYVFNLANRTFISVNVASFDPLTDSPISGGGNPDTYLELRDLNGNVITANDDISPTDANSALPGLVLDGGTYYLEVTSPASAPDRTGFYTVRLDIIQEPYLLNLSPALGTTTETVIISGYNFGPSVADNWIYFGAGNPVTPLFAALDTLVVEVPSDADILGQGYPLFIENTFSGFRSDDPAVATHNAHYVFYNFPILSDLPEDVDGPATLSFGETAVGHTGDYRGHFQLNLPAGDDILLTMQMVDTSRALIPAGAPEIALFDPFGFAVPLHPTGDPPNTGGIAAERFLIPYSGLYDLFAAGTIDGINEGFYQIHLGATALPTISSLQIISGDNQVIEVLTGTPAYLSPLVVQVLQGAAPVQDYPVVYDLAPEITRLSDVAGEATTDPEPIPAPAIGEAGTIFAYPAGHPELGVIFDFMSVAAIVPGSCLPNARVDLIFDPEDTTYPAGSAVDVELVVGDSLGHRCPDTTVELTVTEDIQPPGAPSVPAYFSNLLSSVTVTTNGVGEASEVLVLDTFVNIGETRCELGEDLNPSFCRPHTLEATITVSGASDQMILNAVAGDPYEVVPDTAGGTTSPDEYFTDGQFGLPGARPGIVWDYYIYPPLPLYVKVLDQYGNPVPNVEVTFQVLDPIETKPPNFINAVFSPSLTEAAYTLPGESAPVIRPAQFLGDNPTDEANTLTNTTATLGRTWAMYIFGNTENMTYQFEASAPGAAPVTLTGYATLYDTSYLDLQLEHRLLEDTRAWCSPAPVSETLPVYATVVTYAFQIPSCTTQCVVSWARVPATDVIFDIYIEGAWDYSVTLPTNALGVATLQHTVQSGWNDILAFTDLDFRWINAVEGIGIDIQMERVLEDGSTEHLDDGGQVFFTDQGVQVTIDNILWKELELVIEEKPVVSGGDIVNPDSNKLPVLSSTLNTFFLPLAPDTEGGEVKLYLKDDSTNLDTFTFTVTMANTVEIYPTDNPYNRIPNNSYPSSSTFRQTVEGIDVYVPNNNFIIVALDRGANPPPPSIDYIVTPTPGTTVEARAYNSPGNFYNAQLVSGHTVFTDPSVIGSSPTPWNFYLYSPVIVRTPKLVGQVMMINDSIWDDTKLDLFNWLIERNPLESRSLKIRTILSLFLATPFAIPPDGYDKTSTNENMDISATETETKLSHKVGVSWDSGGQGKINQYYWEASTQFSQDFLASDTFNQSWQEVITDPLNCSLIKSTPEGNVVILDYPDGAGLNFPDSDPDFKFSIGRTDLNGSITVTVGPPNSNPNQVNVASVEVDAYVDDLIDYDYLGEVSEIRWAALLQAGWGKYSGNVGGPGNIFYVQFHVQNIYLSGTYTCDSN